MHFPLQVGPFAQARMLPRLYARSLILGIGIVNLLVVDSTIFDDGFHEGMAEAGPIACTRFRDKGGLAFIRGISNFRHLSL